MNSSRILQSTRLLLLLLIVNYCLLAIPAISRPPIFTSCPGDTVRGSHCVPFHEQVQAIDPDPPFFGRTTSYILADGPGEVDPLTGEWTYAPSGKHPGGTLQVEIAAWDGVEMTTGSENCQFHIIVKPNYVPQIYLDLYECGSGFTLFAPGSKTIPLYTSIDPDSCDQVTTFVKSVTPRLYGEVVLSSNWWLTFVADSLDADKSFLVVVAATDEIDTTLCELTFVTRSIPVPVPYGVRIEKTENTLPGTREQVDVTLTGGTGELGGFDFLLAYDASALIFFKASPGPGLFDSNTCAWEYFTYRYWQPGQCGLDSASALLTVIAMADINNGPYHPSCFLPDTFPAILFTLEFFVTNDLTRECDLVPVSFYWCDCNDNVLSSKRGDTFFVSRNVYDPDAVRISRSDSLPTYFGAPDACLDNNDPYPRYVRVRLVDFYNGSVQIECAEPIDDRGDVNLNGRPYEIADVVMFTNYFLYGLDVFRISPPAQIAATDMNHDGITLDITDLVYGVRVIQGDALPPESLETYPPPTVRFIQDTEAKTVVIETSATLGAALLIFNGDISSPYPHQDMDLKYAYDNDNNTTRLLMYSLGGQSLIQGPLFSFSGDDTLIEAFAATYYGGKVNTVIELRGPLPTGFALHQNYPNPFNNTTTIRFELPQNEQLEIQIINVLGQVVYSHRKYYLAGWHRIEWDGTDNSGSPVSSSVYYYRLTTSEFSESKKMILVK